jgi:PAP2 superfamily protein
VKSSSYLRAALSVLAISSLFFLVSRPFFYHDSTLTAFAVAYSSLFFIFLRARFSYFGLAGIVLLTFLFAVLNFRILGYPATWEVAVTLLSVASFSILLLRGIWSDGDERRLALYTVLPSSLFLMSDWAAAFFLNLTEKARPSVLDLYLYSFDASLRIQFSFVLGRLFAQHHAFALVSTWVYMTLPIAIALVYVGCLAQRRGNALPAFLALFLTGPIGIVLYNLFPAVGPIHVFGTRFPFQPLTIDQVRRLFVEPVAIPGVRNTMPSLHAAWIYLVFWYARSLSRVEKIVASVLVFFTLCATLGIGEHYIIDLVVAVPFTVFILALVNLIVSRRRAVFLLPLSVGLLSTLAWFAALRFASGFFWISPVIPWLACFFTLLLSFYCLRGLLYPSPVVIPTPASASEISA